MSCYEYEPSSVFSSFKVIEFPTSLVGLSTTQDIDVEVNLETDAYIKTTCNGQLMEFDKAREKSASHRAYTITRINNNTLRITFKPNNECIARMIKTKRTENRFIFDLRVIKVNGNRCCNDELHSEIGRFFISGQCEYCNVIHHPKIVNFGNVLLHDKVSKHVKLQNESKSVAAQFKYIKVTNYDVLPKRFTIPPQSSKKIQIYFKPSSERFPKAILFTIRNSYDECDEDDRNICEDDNYVSYSVSTVAKLLYNFKPKDIVVESQHHLFEHNPRYTYVNHELIQHNERKIIKNDLFLSSKLVTVSPAPKAKFSCKRQRCDSNTEIIDKRQTGGNFCKIFKDNINTYFLLHVTLEPFTVNFGRVAVKTFGEQDISIDNNTSFSIHIYLLRHDYIVYTENKLTEHKVKLKPYSKTSMKIMCFGSTIGCHKGSFSYLIDQKFHKSHLYSLEVGNSMLMVQEPFLKFGMVTSETFITSVPVRIYNHFNKDIDFEWVDLHPDIPYEVTPKRGTVPKHCCKLCDITYVCKATKTTKTQEIELISKGQITRSIPIELLMMTRKVTIKFLQQSVQFKDIALNIEAIQQVKLENSSREFTNFVVLDPLVPGIKIEPMSGILKPKMVITMVIALKISCLLEIAFDLLVKINNKEILILPVSANVIEPKLAIHPKIINMPRVPLEMVTFVPVTIQNTGTLRSTVEVIDMKENMCNRIYSVYVANGNEKELIESFYLDPGHSKTVFIKVYDTHRREYDMYIPFRINGLLGPPIITTPHNTWSQEFNYYIGQYEEQYRNNQKVILKTVNKDIPFFRIGGVITVPWIELSVKTFEINYDVESDNSIQFTMTNISKYYLTIAINTGKISPNFSLEATTQNNDSIINENCIKFDLDLSVEANFTLMFHPKGIGQFVAVAPIFFDKSMSIPYANLTFIGRRQFPRMSADIEKIMFPPCYVGTELFRTFTVKLESKSEPDLFRCSSKDEACLIVSFGECRVVEEGNQCYTTIEVTVTACCQLARSRELSLRIHNECGSGCEVEVFFCFTHCPLTLHARNLVSPGEDPYPYYPLSTQTELYEYLEKSVSFLEKWLFQQGYHRDLYPVIPDTFHTISSAMTQSVNLSKVKGMNVSFLNFMRRIAGPLMKYVRKVTIPDVEETYKEVKEIHDMYHQIIHLLKSRGGNVFALKARYLLSFEQFVTYIEFAYSKSKNKSSALMQTLQSDRVLFERLNKQSWIDFILQIYKVFVMDSCFFDCVCVSAKPRDIIQVLIGWYNDQIKSKHSSLLKDSKLKIISNLTTDLSDGVAIASAIVFNCPFLEEHFSMFCEVDEEDPEGAIINNACLIIEAMNLLRLFFPLTIQDFLKPHFLHMLFLSIHLFVVLPTLRSRDTVEFSPPLLRSSLRQIVINPVSQETLTYTFVILNNNTGCFTVEKPPVAAENGKKMFLSVRFKANFVRNESAYLLLHGYNKSRIFDTYIIFHLIGTVGSLIPIRKCKVTGPLYRPSKVDVLVSSPFPTAALFELYLTDTEPCLPVDFKALERKHNFLASRLNLIDSEIELAAKPLRESNNETNESKVNLQIICLSTQVTTSWMWFRSGVGEFFIRISAHCRWDLALEAFQVKVKSWPMDPCSCGEACECYRSAIVMIPHRNDLMVKALRYALLENATDTMMEIFDQLILTTTGHVILLHLLTESGTSITEVAHILRGEATYRISSKSLVCRVNSATLAQHSDAILALPVTVPANDKAEKYTISFTSESGADIRTYRVFFIEASVDNDRTSCGLSAASTLFS